MDECEIKVGDDWKIIGIAAGLSMGRGGFMRCPDCKGRVRVHKAGTTGQRAHFEHRTGQRLAGCSMKSDSVVPPLTNHPMRRVKLPEPVARIYQATEDLEKLYPGRRFTPDGHLVGSIWEVIAAEELGLTLYPMSRAGHDAYDANGEVQIKMTAGNDVAMYANCERLVVLRVVSPEEAEIVYDGSGEAAWSNARKAGKNGQRVVSLTRLRQLAVAAATKS